MNYLSECLSSLKPISFRVELAKMMKKLIQVVAEDENTLQSVRETLASSGLDRKEVGTCVRTLVRMARDCDEVQLFGPSIKDKKDGPTLMRTPPGTKKFILKVCEKRSRPSLPSCVKRPPVARRVKMTIGSEVASKPSAPKASVAAPNARKGSTKRPLKKLTKPSNKDRGVKKLKAGDKKNKEVKKLKAGDKKDKEVKKLKAGDKKDKEVKKLKAGDKKDKEVKKLEDVDKKNKQTDSRKNRNRKTSKDDVHETMFS